MNTKKLYLIAVAQKKRRRFSQQLDGGNNDKHTSSPLWSVQHYYFHETHFQDDKNLCQDRFMSYSNMKLKSVPKVN
jgi:hypothetical protein